MPNKLALRKDGRDIEDLPNAKVLSDNLKKGDAYIVRAGGGGGFGDPRQRDPEKVAADVRNGYVSRAAARELYGVALTEDEQVEEVKTRLLRAQPIPAAA